VEKRKKVETRGDKEVRAGRTWPLFKSEMRHSIAQIKLIETKCGLRSRLKNPMNMLKKNVKSCY
jgi:hypothetical protein